MQRILLNALYLIKMMFLQTDDGWMKIMLCWNRSGIDDCTTPRFPLKDISGFEWT